MLLKHHCSSFTSGVKRTRARTFKRNQCSSESTARRNRDEVFLVNLQAHTENRLQASQVQAEARLQAFQKDLKDSLQASQKDLKDSLQASQKDLKDSLRASQVQTEARLRASQVQAEARLQASQKDLKDSLRASQVQTEARLQASQVQAEARFQSFQSMNNYKQAGITMTGMLGLGTVMFALFETFGGKVVRPQTSQLPAPSAPTIGPPNPNK